MKSNYTVHSDIKLLATLVERLLSEEPSIVRAPLLGDFKLKNKTLHSNRLTVVVVTLRLGLNIKLTIEKDWPNDGDRSTAMIVEAATEMAEAIASAYERQDQIVEMTLEVRAAARKEIAKARRRGVPYRLTYASPGMPCDFISEGHGVNVAFEQLSKSLQSEDEMFVAGCAEDVVEAFATIREEQEERTWRRSRLDAVGASGRIDGVVVNAMREAGHDIAEVLQCLVDSEDHIVNVETREGEPKAFLLYWNNGDVTGQIIVDDNASWHNGELRFKQAPFPLSGTTGRRLRDVMNNSIFGDNVVVMKAREDGLNFLPSLSCTQDFHYFNAETGRLWAA